jgi:hypothetical protein
MFNYFDAIREGTAPAQAVRIPFRKDESIYIKKGNEDQCVVIFSVTFQEKNDWVVAEVFLREFADARRDSALQQAPAANVSPRCPTQLFRCQVVQALCVWTLILPPALRYSFRAEALVKQLSADLPLFLFIDSFLARPQGSLLGFRRSSRARTCASSPSRSSRGTGTTRPRRACLLSASSATTFTTTSRQARLTCM